MKQISQRKTETREFHLYVLSKKQNKQKKQEETHKCRQRAGGCQRGGGGAGEKGAGEREGQASGSGSGAKESRCGTTASGAGGALGGDSREIRSWEHGVLPALSGHRVVHLRDVLCQLHSS